MEKCIAFATWVTANAGIMKRCVSNAREQPEYLQFGCRHCVTNVAEEQVAHLQWPVGFDGDQLLIRFEQLDVSARAHQVTKLQFSIASYHQVLTYPCPRICDCTI